VDHFNGGRKGSSDPFTLWCFFVIGLPK